MKSDWKRAESRVSLYPTQHFLQGMASIKAHRLG